VNGFKFGATENMNALQESSPVSYSDDAVYHQYLRRVLDTTLNQGLINYHNSGGSSVNGLKLRILEFLLRRPRRQSTPAKLITFSSGMG